VIENYHHIESSQPNWVRREWVLLRLAKYYLTHKDLKNAQKFFDRTLEGFRENQQVIPYLSSQIIDLQVRLWAASGELSSTNLNFEEEISFLAREGKFDVASQTARIRYFQTQGKNNQALNIINQIITELETIGMNERLLEVFILQSLIFRNIGKLAQAFTALQQALTIAEPEGYRKVFTDEGIEMKTLLTAFLQENTQTSPLIKTLAEDLINQINQLTQPVTDLAEEKRSTKDLTNPLPEPFSERELEVAHLITQGKSTKEIALAMNISINTTKTHIKNIYRKSDVHTRQSLNKRLIELGIAKNETKQAGKKESGTKL